MKEKSLSGVRLFATPWTEAYQAPLPMGFSKQQYWSGLPLPSSSLLWSSVVISLFPFRILLIWVFSVFFWMSLANGLSNLFIFSKNKLLVLLIFAIVFILFTSALIFRISFLLVILEFLVLLFLVALGVKLGYLIFLLFLEVGLYCYKLPSYHYFYCIP